jgi:hypothetical protein
MTWVPHCRSRCVAGGCALCLGLTTILGEHHDHTPEEPSPLFPAMGSLQINQARGTATLDNHALYTLSLDGQNYRTSFRELSITHDQTVPQTVVHFEDRT